MAKEHPALSLLRQAKRQLNQATSEVRDESDRKACRTAAGNANAVIDALETHDTVTAEMECDVALIAADIKQENPESVPSDLKITSSEAPQLVADA